MDRYIRAVLVVAMLMGPAVVGSLMVPESASATTYESVITSSTSSTRCTGTGSLCETAEAVMTVNMPVHMVCWRDAIWTDGNSHRWFYVLSNNGNEGFVHAENVGHQISTPGCSTIGAIGAADWALQEDGRTTTPYAMNGYPAGTPWSGYCWLFSYEAWVQKGLKTPRFGPKQGDTTAQQAETAYAKANLMHGWTWDPPRGSLLFYRYGSAGHVAISLGSGWMETTQGDIPQRLPVTHMGITKLGLTTLGFVLPGNV